MLPVLLASFALAGEVQIEGIPATFAVDTRIIEPTDAGVRSPPLSDGVHRLDARSSTGEVVAAIDLTIAADERVVVQYAGGAFTIIQREPLVVSTVEAGQPGSISLLGLDRGAFVVRLAGEVLPYSYPIRSFVALDVPAGEIGFVVSLEGEEILTGVAAVPPGQHASCTVLYNQEMFSSDCAAGGTALTAAEVDLVQPISEMKLISLIREIDAAGRATRQLEILSEAVLSAHFTCSQLSRLVEPILFGADRLEAVTLTLPVLLDPDNAGLLEPAFSFGTDRRQMRRLFE